MSKPAPPRQASTRRKATSVRTAPATHQPAQPQPSKGRETAFAGPQAQPPLEGNTERKATSVRTAPATHQPAQPQPSRGRETAAAGLQVQPPLEGNTERKAASVRTAPATHQPAQPQPGKGRGTGFAGLQVQPPPGGSTGRKATSVPAAPTAYQPAQPQPSRGRGTGFAGPQAQRPPRGAAQYAKRQAWGLHIGLMSGTSLDGADGVLVDFSGDKLQVVASASAPFTDSLRAELLALNTASHNELHRAALAGNQLAGVYAEVVQALLEAAARQGIAPHQIQATGVHGQTVRHQPQRTSTAPSGVGYTLQLNNPALLAELTGIDVVADFRSRDVAAGGQGAPLVPAFHQGVFGRADATVAVLNLGGMANLSVLPPQPDAPVLGFDCGPGNALMDAWCLQHTGQPFDAGGAWAASGQLVPQLLASLLDEPYFSQPIPKSTGRDLFSLDWMAQKLAPFAAERPADVQHTLTELTAKACVASVRSYAKDSKQLIVCGGGAFNLHVLRRLQMGLPWLRVSTSDQHGLPPLQVEAAAFAWLARQMLQRQPGNRASVTGAAGPRVLGALYPA